MKKLLTLTLIVTTIVSSCAKKDNPQETVFPTQTTVTINGTAYATKVIGSQTWTIENYKGDGGITHTMTGSDLKGTTKLYTYNEAIAVKLPTGWRLPTREDYTKLLLFIGGTKDSNGDGTATGSVAAKLVSVSWSYSKGDNSTEFGGWPFGFYNSASASIQGQNVAEVFWTSTPVANDTKSYGFGISNYVVNGVNLPLTAYLDYFRPADKLALRFVKAD